MMGMDIGNENRRDPVSTTPWVLWEFVEEDDFIHGIIRHRAHYIDAFESKEECLDAKDLLPSKLELICAPVGITPDQLYTKLLRDKKGKKGTIRDKDQRPIYRGMLKCCCRCGCETQSLSVIGPNAFICDRCVREECRKLNKDADTFRHVYAGGHHAVYCNGKSHVKLVGESFGHSPTSRVSLSVEIEMFSCDCSDYR